MKALVPEKGQWFEELYRLYVEGSFEDSTVKRSSEKYQDYNEQFDPLVSRSGNLFT